MDPESSPDSAVIPPALLAKLKAFAEQERRPVADILRDLVEQGLAERQEWQAHAENERHHARKLGIYEPADDTAMTDEYRLSVREKIAQGMQSLREGKGTDGEAFFAEIYAELDTLERHDAD